MSSAFGLPPSSLVVALGEGGWGSASSSALGGVAGAAGGSG